jgi:hypothetical protein
MSKQTSLLISVIRTRHLPGYGLGKQFVSEKLQKQRIIKKGKNLHVTNWTNVTFVPKNKITDIIARSHEH